jgi:uncharacterized protein YjcR
MIAVIDNYLLLKKHVPDFIEKSGYRNDYIAEKIGMSPSYFAVKKKRGNWSDDEISKIMLAISNDAVNDFFDKLMIKNCFPGNTVSSIEFEKIMGWL